MAYVFNQLLGAQLLSTFQTEELCGHGLLADGLADHHLGY